MEIEYSTIDAVKKAFPNRIIYEHLYWIPRTHRFFQLSTPINDPYLHHEVIRRSSGIFIELHFEGDDYSVKYQGLIDYLINSTADLTNFVWEDWGSSYRCQYASVMENERQLIETLAFFMPKIDGLIEGLPLVAHNKPFDEGCLKAVFRVYQMDYPDYEFYDTLCVSRRKFPHLPNHQLHTVAAACGYILENHHHALADAEACAWIAREIL